MPTNTDPTSAPVITVALPVYNGEQYLPSAIESLLGQTFEQWRLVIYDNCSTDSTGAICREFARQDPRIRYVRQRKNIGLARNFSAAFRPTRTPYFKWMAHDDLAAPTVLAECLAALESEPQAVLAYPAAVAIDADGKELPGYDLGAEPDLTVTDAEQRFRAYCGLPRPSVARYIFALMRTDAVRRTRLMRSHMWADATLLSELLLQGTFVPVPTTTNYLRVFDGHASALMGKRELRAWQAVLDPRFAGRFGTLVSRYRRYEEHFVSVGRADLPVSTKARLMAFSATLPVRRIPELIARELRTATA